MTPITPLGSRYGINSALGRSVKRAAAGGGWWDLNGTITSCVAAYQPKGAASYAASLVNLTGNTDYNATEIAEPGWDSTNGWTNYDAAANLDTGVVFDSINMSMIVRFANYDPTKSSSYAVIVGQRLFRKNFSISAYIQARIYFEWGDGSVSISGVGTTGVAALTQNVGYYNGSVVGTISAINSGISNTNIRIFSGQDAYLSILAFAIYDSVLTSTQIGNLTTAMNAL